MQSALTARLQAFFRRRKDRKTFLFAQLPGGAGIGIPNRGQTNSGPGLLQLTVDAEMISAKGADTENGDAQSLFTAHGHRRGRRNAAFPAAEPPRQRLPWI